MATKKIPDHVKTIRAIGRAMRQKAFELKMSNRELSSKSGVNEMTIYKIFNEKQDNPTIETIFSIASVLKMGVTLEVK